MKLEVGFILLRVCYISCLLLLFYFVFGKNSLQKFEAKETLVIKTSRRFEKEDNPAITVFPTVLNGLGWKTNTTAPRNNVLGTICKYANTSTQAVDCIRNNTFDLSDMLINTIDGNGKKLNESDWIEDISLLYVGRTQTLAPSSVYIGSDLDHPFKMIFQDNLLFYPHVHDPNFFVLGPNPLSMTIALHQVG